LTSIQALRSKRRIRSQEESSAEASSSVTSVGPTWVFVLLVCIMLAWPRVARGEEVWISASGDWASALEALSPGDIALLEPGVFVGGRPVTLRGEVGRPITIRGAVGRASVFDGETGGSALELRASANVILEGLDFTNPSPYGWSLDPRDGEFSYAGGAARGRLAEGLVINSSERIVVRRSRFHDIATRGVLVSDSDRVTVEYNLFVRIGDDTAGGDLNFTGNQTTRWVARGNLFAGNVDGMVNHWASAGGLAERNLVVYEVFENGIDIKFHWQRYDEPPWSVIRNNIVYADQCDLAGIEIQDGTSGVRIVGNIVHGAANRDAISLQLRGRSRSLSDIAIIGNWFDSFGTGGSGLLTRVQSSEPADILDVWILHNIFSGYDRGLVLGHGGDLHVHNNIFTSSPIDVSTGPVSGSRNLYDGTPVWPADSSPIEGVPLYAESPVGPLTSGSPGFGDADTSADGTGGFELGSSIGLPLSGASLSGLEASILCELQAVFEFEEIRECMVQGGRPYEAMLPCDSGIGMFDGGTGAIGTGDAGTDGGTGDSAVETCDAGMADDGVDGSDGGSHGIAETGCACSLAPGARGPGPGPCLVGVLALMAVLSRRSRRRP